MRNTNGDNESRLCLGKVNYTVSSTVNDIGTALMRIIYSNRPKDSKIK